MTQLININQIQSKNSHILVFELPQGVQLNRGNYAQLTFQLYFQLTIDQLNGANYFYVTQGGVTQKITFNMHGFYQSTSDSFNAILTILQASYTVDLDQEQITYRNKMRLIFDQATEIMCDDYYFCKTIGAIYQKNYVSVVSGGNHIIEFDLLSMNQICQQINVVSNANPNFCTENQIIYSNGSISFRSNQLCLLFQTVNQSHPGNIILLNNLKPIVTKAAQWNGISLQFYDEAYQPLPLQDQYVSRLSMTVNYLEDQQYQANIKKAEYRQQYKYTAQQQNIYKSMVKTKKRQIALIRQIDGIQKNYSKTQKEIDSGNLQLQQIKNVEQDQLDEKFELTQRQLIEKIQRKKMQMDYAQKQIQTLQQQQQTEEVQNQIQELAQKNQQRDEQIQKLETQLLAQKKAPKIEKLIQKQEQLEKQPMDLKDEETARMLKQKLIKQQTEEGTYEEKVAKRKQELFKMGGVTEEEAQIYAEAQIQSTRWHQMYELSNAQDIFEQNAIREKQQQEKQQELEKLDEKLRQSQEFYKQLAERFEQKQIPQQIQDEEEKALNQMQIDVPQLLEENQKIIKKPKKPIKYKLQKIEQPEPEQEQGQEPQREIVLDKNSKDWVQHMTHEMLKDMQEEEQQQQPQQEE